MARTKSFKITERHADAPDALQFFLSLPDRPPIYRWWRQLFDRWAGVRDRLPMEQHKREGMQKGEAGSWPIAESPWLRRLIAECNAATAVGRTHSDAVVTVLDQKLAEFCAEDKALQALVSDLGNTHAEVVKADHRSAGAGDRYCTEEELQQRHVRMKAEGLAEIKGRQSAAAARRAELAQQITKLEQARAGHWSVLQERTRLLTEHYQRRASSYTSGMERRRRGMRYHPPEIVAPDWVEAALGTGGHRH